VTIVTENRLSFGVFQAVVIWCFIIASTIVPAVLSAWSRQTSGCFRAYFGFAVPASSYSPSAPVLTSTKYSRMDFGRRNALGFFSSRENSSGPKVPGIGSRAPGWRDWQTLQNHSSGKLPSIMGGSTHLKWNDRVHPSQQTKSPFPPHAAQ
jgi:hypothetical protein